MDKTILQGYDPKTREETLKDSCVKRESFTYPKQLSEDELTGLKHEYSHNAIKLDKSECELKEIKEKFKEEQKPIKSSMKDQMQKIRTGIEEKTEEVFLMDDQDEGFMGYYNKDGELVYQRPLLPNERQLRINSKTA